MSTNEIETFWFITGYTRSQQKEEKRKRSCVTFTYILGYSLEFILPTVDYCFSGRIGLSGKDAFHVIVFIDIYQTLSNIDGIGAELWKNRAEEESYADHLWLHTFSIFV